MSLFGSHPSQFINYTAAIIAELPPIIVIVYISHIS